MKPLSEYTIEELLGLPIFKQFASDNYVVDENGEVRVMRGDKEHVLRGLTPGDTVYVPRAQQLLCTPFGPNDPMFFLDETGDAWRPVMTPSGWARMRFF